MGNYMQKNTKPISGHLLHIYILCHYLSNSFSCKTFKMDSIKSPRKVFVFVIWLWRMVKRLTKLIYESSCEGFFHLQMDGQEMLDYKL